MWNWDGNTRIGIVLEIDFFSHCKKAVLIIEQRATYHYSARDVVETELVEGSAIPMPQREKQSFVTNRSPSYLANLPVRSLTFACFCFRVGGLPTVPEQGFFDILTERNSDHTLPCIQSAVGIGNSKPCRVLTLSGS